MSSQSPEKPKAYRLLSGQDDAAFCLRVSEALYDGYILYGPPLMQIKPDGTVWVAQAVILPDVEPGRSPL